MVNRRRSRLENLRNEMNQRLQWYTVSQGKGGLLILLWTAGRVLFFSVLGLPLYALAWTGTALVILLLMMNGYRSDPDAQKAILRDIMGKHYPLSNVEDAALRPLVGKALDVFVELTVRTRQLERGRGGDPGVQQALVAADDMIALQ